MISGAPSGGVAGAGAGGLASLLGGPWGMALGLLGTPLLGSLFSGSDPARRRESQIMRLLNPEYIRSQGIADYQNLLKSPVWGEARRSIIDSGAQLERSVSNNFARAGLNMSGIGAVAPALAHSSIGTNLGKMTADAWQSAMTNARSNAYQQASILSGAPMPQNYPAQFTGAGMNALLAYILKRYGG